MALRAPPCSMPASGHTVSIIGCTCARFAVLLCCVLAYPWGTLAEAVTLARESLLHRFLPGQGGLCCEASACSQAHTIDTTLGPRTLQHCSHVRTAQLVCDTYRKGSSRPKGMQRICANCERTETIERLCA